MTALDISSAHDMMGCLIARMHVDVALLHVHVRQPLLMSNTSAVGKRDFGPVPPFCLLFLYGCFRQCFVRPPPYPLVVSHQPKILSAWHASSSSKLCVVQQKVFRGSYHPRIFSNQTLWMAVHTQALCPHMVLPDSIYTQYLHQPVCTRCSCTLTQATADVCKEVYASCRM